MKKFFLGLIGIVFVSIMALSLSSCGEDPVASPEKDLENNVSLMVGRWKMPWGAIMEFKSDHTGVWADNEGESGDLVWAYSEMTNILDITYTDEQVRHFVEWVDDNCMFWYEVNSDGSKGKDYYTIIRQ
jgi:hypothetical protein